MNFSFGGGKRGLVLIAATVLTASMSSCASDKPSPAGAPKISAAPDKSAKDVTAVENLVDHYWAAVVNSENAVDPSPEPFHKVANGSFIEFQLKTVRDYKAAGVRRVGNPDITKVEVVVDGDAADVRACLNEDKWTAKMGGKTIKAPKLGPVPWGAEASRSGDTWLITDVRVPPKGEKVCS